MMKYLQRLGRSLMLPIAVLPAAALLLGIGYAIDPSGWGGNSPLAAFLVKAGSSIIDNMGILFALGVSIGLSKDKSGAAALTGLVGWLVSTVMLNPEAVAQMQSIDVEAVNPAFGKVETQFLGIIIGIIASVIYNKFNDTKLPQALAFFSGRRLPPILMSFASLLLVGVMMFVWPPVYTGLTQFGEWMVGLGAVGAGLYAFFNRLLIPTGLHHALNAVFWFDLAGIDDINKFWSGTGELGVTGMYQGGFFPIMMFGLPAAALAIYTMADKDQKKKVGSLMLAAGVATFVTGVTEPLEFAFMFIAPILYGIHALLTGISLFIAATFGWTAGFGFSAGAIDYALSFNLPLANKPYMLIIQGLVFAAIYYFVFVAAIKAFDLKTPGRGVAIDEDANDIRSALSSDSSSDDKYPKMAKIILDGLGGAENVDTLNYCTSRLRMELKDTDKVDENRILQANVPAVRKQGGPNVHVIVGTDVEFVAREMEKLI